MLCLLGFSWHGSGDLDSVKLLPTQLGRSEVKLGAGIVLGRSGLFGSLVALQGFKTGQAVQNSRALQTGNTGGSQVAYRYSHITSDCSHAAGRVQGRAF